MFGREARLPVDLCFNITLDEENETSHLQYVEKLKKDLKKAYKLATEAANKNHLRNKARYDQRVRGQTLAEGDRVLLRNLSLTGKHKLQDRWKSTPYVIVRQLPNLPVYEVKPESGSGSSKTLHRDHLLPIGYLVRMPDVQDKTEKAVHPHVTRSQSNNKHQRLKQFVPDDYSNSESDWEVGPQHDSIDMDEVERRVLSTHRPSAQIHEAQEENSEDIESQTSDLDLPDKDSEDSENDASDNDLSDNNLSDKNLSRHSQRQSKPVIRLTYDKPGHSLDKPVTIVHHGMVIQLDLSPKIADSSSKYKVGTPSKKPKFKPHRVR